jgi:dTDP-4-dehydrorhamnose 3,5-epimerase
VAEVSAVSEIEGVYIVTPQRFEDDRGVFAETYRRSWFPEGREMVQGSRSDKVKGSLVGLHYHLHQADYWYVVSGKAQVALVDIRVGSPTELGVYLVELGDDNLKGLYIPPGVAHGFAVVEDMVLTYLVDGYYNPNDELGVRFDDPSLGVSWAISTAVVSQRDLSNPLYADIKDYQRPRYGLRT